MKTTRLLLICLAVLLSLNSYSQFSLLEYKAAGDEAYHSFLEENTKVIIGDVANHEKMYSSLYTMYMNYLPVIQEGKNITDDLTYEDIAVKIKEGRASFVNAGIYYHEKQDYVKAMEFFVAHWDIPSLWIFDANEFDQDVTSQMIKYYAVVCAIQADNSEQTISLLNRLISEPYIQNDTYKESDPYELLANEYQKANDQGNYMRILNYAMRKFPDNKYFLPNLINEFIKNDDLDGAVILLDKALKDGAVDNCTVNSVKGSIYVTKEDRATAEKVYKEALKKDRDCGQALEGLGVLYALIAQDIKEKATMATNRKEQAALDKSVKNNYQKSLGYLVKYKNLLEKNNAEQYDLISVLTKLQNVYYNLTLLGVDYSEQYDKTESEIERLRN